MRPIRSVLLQFRPTSTWVAVTLHLACGLHFACSGSPEPLAPAPTVQLRDLEYQASVRLDDRHPDAIEPPDLLLVDVIITNTGPAPVTSSIGGCIAALSVFRDAARRGKPTWGPWDPREACLLSPQAFVLGPGESRKFETGIYTSQIRQEAGWEGRYYFSVGVHLADRTLEVAAGELDLTSGLTGLTYAAAAAVVDFAPTQFQAHVTVSNPTARRVWLEYGSCALRVRLYPSAKPTGSPVWDSARREILCPAYLAGHELEPGASFSAPEFAVQVAVPEILGDSLPDGRYLVSASLMLNYVTVELEAGTVDLIAAQAPTPAERVIDEVSYRAAIRPVEDSSATLRLALTVANGRPDSVELGSSTSGHCAVLLVGYRDPVRRDAWYEGGDADWVAPGCVVTIPRVTLAPGESRTFEGDFLAPALPGSASGDGIHFLVFFWPMPDDVLFLRVVLAAGSWSPAD